MIANAYLHILSFHQKMEESDKAELITSKKMQEENIEIANNINTSPRSQSKPKSKLVECLISFHIPIGLTFFLIIALICPAPGILMILII